MTNAQGSFSNQWRETDSATFIEQGELFVPARAEQMQILLHLLPAALDEEFTVVELASGEGLLAEAILERFPRCHYIALDGSELMRERLKQRLPEVQDRLEVRPFDLAAQDWRTALPSDLRCILSSLCVHHLSDAGKQQLFQDLFPHISQGGALLLADILRPVNEMAARLYAEQYDQIVRVQSLSLRGDLSGFEELQTTEWNYFRHDYYEPASYDQPSLLSDQLLWLREAGFSAVDCFWLRAGHAVYGGFK